MSSMGETTKKEPYYLIQWLFIMEPAIAFLNRQEKLIPFTIKRRGFYEE